MRFFLLPLVIGVAVATTVPKDQALCFSTGKDLLTPCLNPNRQGPKFLSGIHCQAGCSPGLMSPGLESEFFFPKTAFDTIYTGRAFRARKEYRYSYDTQLVTGQPPSSTIFSGFRLSASARVQFSTYTKVVVQLEKVVLYQLNNPVIQQRAEENLIPEEFLKELVGPEADMMIKVLRIPFGFEYESGHVIKIILDDGETEWSANAKRGFVSLFEMNLEKRMVLEDSAVRPNIKMGPNTDSYKVFERSASGDCATFYTVKPTGSDSHTFVTKVRDFEECLERPVYLTSIFDGFLPIDYKKDRPLTQGATLEYAVRGTADKFLILSAIAENKIVFSPYRGYGQILTSVNQTLLLIDVKSIAASEEIPEILQGKHKKQELRMTLPGKSVDPQDPFRASIEEPRQDENPADVYFASTILNHLRQASENTEELASKESLVHLRVVVEMLRTSPLTIIKELWGKLSRADPKEEKDKLAAKIFWNVLPHVGTEAAASHILDVCTEDYQMAENCTMSLNVLTLKATPTTLLINQFIKLIEERQHEYSKELKQVAYLSLGSLGYKLSKAKHDQLKHLDKADRILENLQKDNKKHVRLLVKDLKKKMENRRNSIVSLHNQIGHTIVETIRKLIEKGNTDDKILGLKSLANSGLPQAMPVLKKILINPSEQQFLRIMAIIGYRRMYLSDFARQDAQKLLLNIYMNTKETNEVRTMSFVILMNLKPELSLVESITRGLHYEKDAHVSSLVLSYLESYANSTFSPIWPLIKNYTAALVHAPKIYKGYAHSFTKMISKYYDNHKSGLSLKLTSIGSMYRFMGGALNLDSYIYGLYSNFFEAGINSEGMSQFMDKLFGPRGLLTSNKSLFDLLRRKPRNASPQELLQEIFRMLRIKPRMLAFPAAHMYFKLMGHELRYYDLTKYLTSINTEGKLSLSFDEERLKAGLPVNIKTMIYLLDTKLILPTDAGLPVSLKAQISSTIKVQGSLSFQVGPYMLEEERQGRPPLGLNTYVDLKPKSVFGLYASMGLDWHYIKPATAIRGLLKFDMPIHQEFSYDLPTSKFKTIKYMNNLDKPVTEILIEPYAESVKLTNTKKTPTLRVDIVPIYAPIGSKVLPVNTFYEAKCLGYKFGFMGQIPTSFSLMAPFQPLSGRTVINFWMKPLENASKIITMHGKFLYPERKLISNSYAQNYQETLTSYDDRRDISKVEDSDALNFDKYRRPMPFTPYRDPVDLDKQKINLKRVAAKLEHVSGKPMPYYNKPEARGLLMTIDASTDSVERKAQLESLWSYFNDGQINTASMRIWRSSLPDYDSKPWQMLSEFGMTYPYKIYEPKDIFSKEWQQEIMKDLQYLISIDSHKVVNEIMNLTLLSELEQFNYPAMTKAPTTRLLDTLIPEQLYKLMNCSGRNVYSTDWQKYWKLLGPVFLQVAEESKLVVDPNFINRDSIILNYYDQLIRVQKDLMYELDSILQKSVIAHAELPIAQWIVAGQAKVVFTLGGIVQRDIMTGVITQIKTVEEQLLKSKQYMNSITIKMNEILFTVSTECHDTDENGMPVIFTSHGRLIQKSQKYSVHSAYDQRSKSSDRYDSQESEYQQYSQGFGSQPSAYYTPEDIQSPIDSQSDYLSSDNSNAKVVVALDSLRSSLYNLSLFQSEVIKEIQFALYHKKEIEMDRILSLIKFTSANLTFFDNIWKVKPIYNHMIIEKMLLVSAQNEFVVLLFEQYKNQDNMENAPKRNVYYKEVKDIYESYLVKVESYFLGQRVASLYKNLMLKDVVVPELSDEELPIFQDIQSQHRRLAVDMREFEIKLAYNKTAMRNEAIVSAAFSKFIKKMDSHIDKLFRLEKAITELDVIPKVYLVTDLIETINYLKNTVEFGRTSILPLSYHQRFLWLSALDRQATRVQTLMSSMSPIFDKFVARAKGPMDESMSIFNKIPTDVKVLKIQDILVQQNMMLQEIRKFLQDPHVSSLVLQRMLATVVERSQALQQSLAQSQLQVNAALDQRQHYERFAISSVYTQAINQQRQIYNIVQTALSNKQDQLMNVQQLIQKVQSLEYSLSSLEDDINQKLLDLQAKDEQQATEETVLDGDYQSFSREEDIDFYKRRSPSWNHEARHSKLSPLEPGKYYPSGITGLWNVTWGNEDFFDKNMKVQLLATRNVEQLIWIYKQMDAMVRSYSLQNAINDRLMDELWETGGVMDTLNTFNHLHFIAEYDKKVLPEWMASYGQRAHDFFKYLLWNQFSRQSPAPFMTEDKVQAIFDISEFNQQWDMFLLTDLETNKFLNIPIYRWLKAFKFNQNFQPLSKQMMSYVTSNFVPAQCFVNKGEVKTFDKVIYQLPSEINKCRTLLAMDCSPEKTFAVTMVKSNSSYQGHILQILNEDKVIEIIPGYLDVEVRVNDKVLVLEESKPLQFNKQLHYDLYEPYLTIVRKGLKVDIELPLTGVYITAQGSFVKIQVSELFKKKICGLCGNFDTQLSWEFEGPLNEIHRASKSFAYSYVMHDARCPFQAHHKKVPDLHPNPPNQYPDYSRGSPRYSEIMRSYRLKGSEPHFNLFDEDENESKQHQGLADNQHKPKALTDVRYRKKKSQTCFSELLFKCAKNYPTPMSTERKKVAYVCLNSEDQQVKDLEETAARGGIVDLEKVVGGERVYRWARNDLACKAEDDFQP